jgi:hypothetical protein
MHSINAQFRFLSQTNRTTLVRSFILVEDAVVDSLDFRAIFNKNSTTFAAAGAMGFVVVEF